MLNIFWELNKINTKVTNVLLSSVNNKIFLKKATSEIITPKMIEIINENEINICFNIKLEVGDILMVEDKNYILENRAISEFIPKEEKIVDDSIENFEIIPPPEINIKYSDGVLELSGNIETPVKLLINLYTAESYPDYPFEIKKSEIKLLNGYKTDLKVDGGIKCVVEVQDSLEAVLKSLLIETQPLCYFSNVISLKKDIIELNVKVPEYPDEDLKKLITEKSIVLYSKFGLLYEQRQNPLLTPLYKSIVNLYCIKDLMALGFLSRQLDGSTDSGGGTVSGLGQIQLGNLSLKDNSSSSGGSGSSGVSSLLGTTIIEDLIKIEEEKLTSALSGVSQNITKREVKNYGYKQPIRFHK